MKRVLLIEDERNMARFIELELRHEGFEVAVAYDGRTGLERALGEPWDVVLLDLMLPGLDGLELCRQLRGIKRTPIVMLSARDAVADRVSGLDLGADDYIPKPFAMEELLARIRVIFRRQEEDRQYLVYQDLSMDLATRSVTRGIERLALTKREYDLLAAFMQYPNRALSRELLLDKVWGLEAEVDANVVDVYVRYLRNKIDAPERPGSYIQTLRGIGYMLKR
ncbi:DNA-binding response regulator [Paenibacillus sp. 598K]|uniref:response regulator transcription factor n=1 Tax=Paenibacillus sp. 598K TaxID=1117987 RepID=UPI000FF9111D|nr:response regulator transcription factor [Paenibacillus sp. 598K]GBF72099.1 DNA-binding response regulator [Paenibacillus sp. 598K]